MNRNFMEFRCYEVIEDDGRRAFHNDGTQTGKCDRRLRILFVVSIQSTFLQVWHQAEELTAIVNARS